MKVLSPSFKVHRLKEFRWLIDMKYVWGDQEVRELS
jgi:hypothetical protein